MPIDLATRVAKSSEQISYELDGEVGILSLKSAAYFGLNEVGAAVWASLSEPKTAAAVCKEVLDRFDVEEQQCHEDVLELLTNLNEAGLIEIAGSRPGPEEIA